MAAYVELAPCSAAVQSLSPLKDLLRTCLDRDVTNKTLGVFVDPFPPYTVIEAGPSSSSSLLTGYNGDVWRIVEQVLGLRESRLLVVDDFGEAQRGLKQGAGDVFLHPIIITPTDVDELGFSVHVTSTWYELYLRRPDTQATWQAYVHACSYQAWAAILGCVLLLALVRTLVLASSPTRHSAIISVLGAVFNQGVQESWREGGSSPPQRVLTTFTLAFGLLLMNSYSAVLTARLTVVVTPLPFHSLHDLRMSAPGTHAVCVRKNNFADSLFTTQEGGDVLPEWEGVVRAGPCSDFRRPSQVRSKACLYSVALLETPALMADALGDAPPCHVTRVDSTRYAKASAALQFRPRFPYAAAINSRLQRMHEVGVTHFLRNKWITKALPEGGDSAAPGGGSVVPSRHYEAILTTYMAALAFSGLLLVAEVLISMLLLRHQQ